MWKTDRFLFMQPLLSHQLSCESCKGSFGIPAIWPPSKSSDLNLMKQRNGTKLHRWDWHNHCPSIGRIEWNVLRVVLEKLSCRCVIYVSGSLVEAVTVTQTHTVLEHWMNNSSQATSHQQPCPILPGVKPNRGLCWDGLSIVKSSVNEEIPWVYRCL